MGGARLTFGRREMFTTSVGRNSMAEAAVETQQVKLKQLQDGYHMGCKQRLLNTVHVQSYLECHPCGNNGSCVSKWFHVEGYSRVGVVHRTVLYIIWSIAPLERRN